MTTTVTGNQEADGAAPERIDVKVVPSERAVRARVRAEAARVARGLGRVRPLTREELEGLGRQVVSGATVEQRHLGFAMVCVSNEFWREQFSAVPPSRRLLLLPHCLRHAELCPGDYSPGGLECRACGACSLLDLRLEAEGLGYRVLIAEGTPAVVDVALRGEAEAILGVACLDSLDHAFDRVAQLGVPHVALPLLVDGCRDTVAELEAIRDWLRLHAPGGGVRTRSYLPLLRLARALFADEEMVSLLGPAGCSAPAEGSDVGAVAMEWVRSGGKRFRPFITLAAYAALAQGADALRPDADLSGAFPTAVRRTALAMEILHKASLVHDDIEDDDAYRYGRPTLHRRYGVGPAINVGDYLVGLGYRCVCAGAAELGAECVSDLVSALSQAHLRLCQGQGMELRHHGGRADELGPVDVQTIYALKTAPAFEVAMYAGLRAASHSGRQVDIDLIRPFSRYLGVAYQVANDLKDWEGDSHNKLLSGQDTLSDRPTMLRAFAREAAVTVSSTDGIESLRRAYEDAGVFARARRLVRLYKERALNESSRAEPPALAQLMCFVVETLL